jgi:hypothetical protein
MHSASGKDLRTWSSSARLIRRTSPRQMLEDLFALDQMLVEVSMQLYNLSRRERSKMRAQNRRLHAAVRRHLPELIKRYRSQNT